MAVSDYLLELKSPVVKGESLDKQYKDAIEIDSWSWSGHNASTHQFGSGGGAGKVSLGDIQFSKSIVDSATVTLFSMLCKGTHVKEAILHCRKKGGGKEGSEQVEFLKISMKNCTVSSLSLGGHGSATGVSESASLAYEEIKFEYTKQKEDGTKDATSQGGWNVAKNAEAA
jgi:type VI secretion system secreted protein Hcp